MFRSVHRICRVPLTNSVRGFKTDTPHYPLSSELAAIVGDKESNYALAYKKVEGIMMVLRGALKYSH
jgi:hypothetical protein